MVTFHHITSENSALLSSVDEDVFDHAITPEWLEPFLAAPGHALFVAVEDGMVVGHARGIVHMQPDKASDLYIDNLGVAESHKRMGVATRLVRDLTDWGKAGGCAYVWVATEPDNEVAIAFYGAQRFEQQTMAYFGTAIEEG
jgi:ribosomal protein S18 acetylase RimI-like enzyme